MFSLKWVPAKNNSSYKKKKFRNLLSKRVFYTLSVRLVFRLSSLLIAKFKFVYWVWFRNFKSVTKPEYTQLLWWRLQVEVEVIKELVKFRYFIMEKMLIFPNELYWQMDRTSILGDTIDYMKELLERINNLQEEIHEVDSSNQFNLMSIFKDVKPNEVLIRNSPKVSSSSPIKQRHWH